MKVLILGPQGSGKSTQAELLAKKFHWPHVEMGELLRTAAEEDTEEGREIRSSVESGALADFESTVEILERRLSENDCSQNYVLDGFPRNIKQIKLFDPLLDKVIYLTLPDEMAIKRLTKRGREDDTPEIIKQRLEIFHNETEPVLDYFRAKGILEEVDGKPDVETIFNDLMARIENSDGQKPTGNFKN